MKPIKQQYWLSYDGYPFQVLSSIDDASVILKSLSSKPDFQGDLDKFGVILVKCYDCSYLLNKKNSY